MEGQDKDFLSRLLSRLDTLHDFGDGTRTRTKGEDEMQKEEFTFKFKGFLLKSLDEVGTNRELNKQKLRVDLHIFLQRVVDHKEGVYTSWLQDNKEWFINAFEELIDRKKSSFIMNYVSNLPKPLNFMKQSKAFEPAVISFFELLYTFKDPSNDIGQYITHPSLPTYDYTTAQDITKKKPKQLPFMEFVQLYKAEKIVSVILGKIDEVSLKHATGLFSVGAMSEDSRYSEYVKRFEILFRTYFIGTKDTSTQTPLQDKHIFFVIDTSNIRLANYLRSLRLRDRDGVKMHVICNVAMEWDSASGMKCDRAHIDENINQVFDDARQFRQQCIENVCQDEDVSGRVLYDFASMNLVEQGDGQSKNAILVDKNGQEYRGTFEQFIGDRSIGEIARCVYYENMKRLGVSGCSMGSQYKHTSAGQKFELKRTGDGFQALLTKHLQDKHTNHQFIFVTLDHLAFLRARMIGVDTIFTSLDKDQNRIATLYRGSIDTAAVLNRVTDQMLAEYKQFSENRFNDSDVASAIATIMQRVFATKSLSPLQGLFGKITAITRKVTKRYPSLTQIAEQVVFDDVSLTVRQLCEPGYIDMPLKNAFLQSLENRYMKPFAPSFTTEVGQLREATVKITNAIERIQQNGEQQFQEALNEMLLSHALYTLLHMYNLEQHHKAWDHENKYYLDASAFINNVLHPVEDKLRLATDVFQRLRSYNQKCVSFKGLKMFIGSGQSPAYLTMALKDLGLDLEMYQNLKKDMMNQIEMYCDKKQTSFQTFFDVDINELAKNRSGRIVNTIVKAGFDGIQNMSLTIERDLSRLFDKCVQDFRNKLYQSLNRNNLEALPERVRTLVGRGGNPNDEEMTPMNDVNSIMTPALEYPQHIDEDIDEEIAQSRWQPQDENDKMDTNDEQDNINTDKLPVFDPSKSVVEIYRTEIYPYLLEMGMVSNMMKEYGSIMVLILEHSISPEIHQNIQTSMQDRSRICLALEFEKVLLKFFESLATMYINGGLPLDLAMFMMLEDPTTFKIYMGQDPHTWKYLANIGSTVFSEDDKKEIVAMYTPGNRLETNIVELEQMLANMMPKPINGGNRLIRKMTMQDYHDKYFKAYSKLYYNSTKH